MFNLIQQKLQNTNPTTKKDSKKLKSEMMPDASPEIIRVNGFEFHIVRESHRRTTYLTMRPGEKPTVKASKNIKQTEIAQFIQLKWSTIENKLKKSKFMNEQNPPKQFIQDEDIWYLGKKLKLNYDFHSSLKGHVQADESYLNIRLPLNMQEHFDIYSPHPEMHEVIRSFYEARARKHILERVHYFADKMQLFPKKVSFRCQTSRWGSCTSEGHISMNWRLMAFPEDVIDYIVIHEISHIRYPHHQKAFWYFVEQFCPNYKELDKWIYHNAYASDFLLPK